MIAVKFCKIMCSISQVLRNRENLRSYQLETSLEQSDALFLFKTKNRIILTKQSGVPKNLTASRILQILIALCQIKAKIHSFPTMYIIGGGKFGLTRWKKCLKPKRSPKNSCFGGNESQLHNFGRVWDPNFLRWPQFGGYPRKATCLSFKMSYVQGP